MATFKVYRHLNSPTLIVESELTKVSNDMTLVGSFRADVMCDYLMNMIKINERTGSRDEYWTKMAKKIEKEGI